MNGCTLCGGKLSAEGKCTECGLDNTKNDKKYKLNTHNEKTARLHLGECEDNLNRKNDQSKKRRNTAEKAGHADRSGRETAATLEIPKRDRKKVRERGMAGTVKKKKGARWFVILICVIIFGFDALLGAVFSLIEGFSDGMGAIAVDVESVIEEIFDEESAEPDATAVRYVQDLEAGLSTAGENIPVGTYRLICTQGSAYVYWWNQESDNSDYVQLYSEEAQKEYEEAYGEPCEYGAVSEWFVLEEDGSLYVETQDGIVTAEVVR